MTTQGADDRAAQHLPLAGTLVREVLRRTPAELVEDDLYAAAVTALVDADADFDPVHDAPYERYVTARIREGMYDELCALDWAAYESRSASERTAASRARMHATLDRFGDRSSALAALRGETWPEAPAAPVVAPPLDDASDLPYLRAALAELPPQHRLVAEQLLLARRGTVEVALDLDVSQADVHLMRAEGLSLLRASLVARHEEEARALSGLDAVTAAVHASRVSFAGGRVDLTVVEHAETSDDAGASTGQIA